MMVNSYYPIYPAAPAQLRDATVGGQDSAGLSLDLPCTQDPELFFAESSQDVEQAKALCRGCRARLACLVGALERREPWGVWGGELLLRGAIVPRKRPRGRPRKDAVAIGLLPQRPGWRWVHPDDGRITRITDFWPDRYELPASRAHLVERY
jgi:WhiB family redox-sensing transcriptional regulator